MVNITDINIHDFVNKYVSGRQDLLPEELRDKQIGDWDVSRVTKMDNLFNGKTTFNENIIKWDVSRVTVMNNMFKNAHMFNTPIYGWNVSNVMDMSYMFQGATNYNQPLSSWNVKKVRYMSGMFMDAISFNHGLLWNVSMVKFMYSMFKGALAFNGKLTFWDVSSVTDMSHMFNGAISFNQPLNKWNIKRVVTMNYMFKGAISFNQPLDKWNMSSVLHKNGIFMGATAFNQPVPNFVRRTARMTRNRFINGFTNNTRRRNIPPIPNQEQQPTFPEYHPNPAISTIDDGLIDYSNVVPINILKINNQLVGNEIAHDLILLEDINVHQYLNEDTANIAFLFMNSYYLSNKNVIRDIILTNSGNIKYECSEVNRMGTAVKTVPYLNMTSIGVPSGLCLLGEIKTILINNDINFLRISNRINHHCVTTASLFSLQRAESYISTSHCQEGQEADVRSIKQCSSIVTGGSKNKTKKHMYY